jgi:hypothetical protein
VADDARTALVVNGRQAVVLRPGSADRAGACEVQASIRIAGPAGALGPGVAALSSDGRWLAYLALDGAQHPSVFDIDATQDLTAWAGTVKHGSPIALMAFDPQASRLATVAIDGSV